jgi:hypothetical protein
MVRSPASRVSNHEGPDAAINPRTKTSNFSVAECAVMFCDQRKWNVLTPHGINVGNIIVDGDDVDGDGVNVAARIQTLADPGGSYISRSAAEGNQPWKTAADFGRVGSPKSGISAAI